MPIRVRSGYALACDIQARATSADTERGAATRRWTSVVERDGGTFYHLAITSDGLQMSGSAPVDRHGRIGEMTFAEDNAPLTEQEQTTLARVLAAAAEFAYSGTTISKTGDIALPGLDALLKASLPAAAAVAVSGLVDNRRVGGVTSIDGEDYLFVHNDASITAAVDGVQAGPRARWLLSHSRRQRPVRRRRDLHDGHARRQAGGGRRGEDHLRPHQARLSVRTLVALEKLKLSPRPRAGVTALLSSFPSRKN